MLQGPPTDLSLIQSRRSRSGRALAAAGLLLAVGGSAYYAATHGPAPAPATAASAALPAANSTVFAPLPLRLDGDWQRTTDAKGKR